MQPPELTCATESTSHAFAAVLPQTALLGLLAALFFMAAYMGFLRKDVR
jgi:hypothetical protein